MRNTVPAWSLEHETKELRFDSKCGLLRAAGQSHMTMKEGSGDNSAQLTRANELGNMTCGLRGVGCRFQV